MFQCIIHRSIFITAMFYIGCAQANYQAEHHTNFDENMRYQFVEDQKYAHLLSQCLPFQPLLQAMLQGDYPYQLLLVDDSSSPYIVIKSTGNYVYVLGSPSNEQLDTILQELSAYKDLVLLCDESLQSYFIQHGFTIQPRIELEYQDHFNLTQKQVPAGFTIQPLDLALFKQSPWFGFLASTAGGSQRFLDVAFGFALVNEQGVSVAQAYGAFIGNGACEIGIVTHPDYRGNGYIMYPAIATMQECLARNLRPIWSCNSENIASLKTAHKLGFSIERHYVFLKKN